VGKLLISLLYILPCAAHSYVDAARVEEALGLAVLRRQSKKPKGFEELLQWFNRGESSICPPSTCASITATAAAADSNNGGEARLAVKPHELCMVGDRSLTDVVFGNVHGMLTVRNSSMVNYLILHSLTWHEDECITSILRLL